MQNSHFFGPPQKKIFRFFKNPWHFSKKPLAFSADQNFPKKSRKPPSLSLRFGPRLDLRKHVALRVSALFFDVSEMVLVLVVVKFFKYSFVFFWKHPPKNWGVSMIYKHVQWSRKHIFFRYSSWFNYHLVLVPEASPLKWLAFSWMIRNLYLGNGWKSPNIHN